MNNVLPRKEAAMEAAAGSSDEHHDTSVEERTWIRITKRMTRLLTIKLDSLKATSKFEVN